MSFKKACNEIVHHNEKSISANFCSVSWFVLFTLTLSLLLVFLDSSVNYLPKIANISVYLTKNKVVQDECTGKYIYVQELPRMFNDELIENCQNLSKWSDLCKSLTNSGLGPRLEDSAEKVFSGFDWFNTDQFSLEVIFHNRMKQYKCLTNDSSKASAIFVPFYAGLDVGRYLWDADIKTRDFNPIELVKYFWKKPEWGKMYGRDHFLVAGRISWDFRRVSENESDWGNRLFEIPEVMNMTNLIIESSPWSRIDFAIPYPTYFHPSSDTEVLKWQNRMIKQKRRYLFSFAGAPRPQIRGSIRNEIIQQCHESKSNHCKLMDCVSDPKKCYNPMNLMSLFENSVFCLQPSGDSYTRRSAFDSILAGCIPVFFHPGSAYVQYLWHLPRNYSSYSVYIPEEEVKNGSLSIEKRLLRISDDEIRRMRDEVIKLIPRVVYANPNSRLEKVEDAFDVAVTEVLKRVEKIRVEIKEGKKLSCESFDEEDSWKFNYFGGVENHEWDSYFDR